MAFWSNRNSYDDDNHRWMSSSPPVNGNDYHHHHHMRNSFPLYDRQDDGSPPPVYPMMMHFPNFRHYPYMPLLPQHHYYPNEAPPQSSPPTYTTTTIGRNDVLCGRGGATNSNSGNKAFRRLVMAHKEEYLNAKKKDKPAVAARVVNCVRNEGGHFLRQHGTSPDGRLVYWVDVGDERAKEKTCQALREGAPAVLRQTKCSTKSSTTPTVNSMNDHEEEEQKKGRPHVKDKLPEERKRHSEEKPMISASDTSSSWESSPHSITEDTVLRPWRHMGWGCEPIFLHQLHPMERELYLRSFVPPTYKKPRLLE